MSNDRVIDVSTPVESASSWAGRMDRARPTGALPADRVRARARRAGEPPPVGRPFADVAEATDVGRACRTMLGRHVQPDQLLDRVAVVLAAKVFDEIDGDAAFEAVPGEPRVSASRFDHVVGSALVALGDTPRSEHWNTVDVPELVAHQILADLGSYSVLRTAELPGGRAAVRGLFAGAAGEAPSPSGSSSGSSSLADSALVTSLWRLAEADRDRRSLAAVAAAAADVFGPAEQPSGETEVLDLRELEAALTRPRRRRS